MVTEIETRCFQSKRIGLTRTKATNPVAQIGIRNFSTNVTIFLVRCGEDDYRRTNPIVTRVPSSNPLSPSSIRKETSNNLAASQSTRPNSGRAKCRAGRPPVSSQRLEDARPKLLGDARGRVDSQMDSVALEGFCGGASATFRNIARRNSRSSNNFPIRSNE